jgi:putative transposase
MHLFHKRQGQMEVQQCYFYTESICGFHHLLQNDELKAIVVDSWKKLVDRELAAIYGYVIMPNHIHLLWSMLQRNGGESAGSSFAKFTAHQFKKYLSCNDLLQLENYVSIKTDRRYQFWKRDPLAVLIRQKRYFYKS